MVDTSFRHRFFFHVQQFRIIIIIIMRYCAVVFLMFYNDLTKRRKRSNIQKLLAIEQKHSFKRFSRIKF